MREFDDDGAFEVVWNGRQLLVAPETQRAPPPSAAPVLSKRERRLVRLVARCGEAWPEQLRSCGSPEIVRAVRYGLIAKGVLEVVDRPSHGRLCVRVAAGVRVER